MTSTETAAPGSPLLQGFADQLASLRRDLAELTDGITPAQFNWSPGPERWSVGQVVRHLNLAGHQYLDAIAAALADGRARGLRDRGDYRPSWIGGMFARSMEPPPRIKLKAPRMWRPAETAETAEAFDPAAELARLRQAHDRAEEQLRAAAGLDLRRIRFVSPASRLVRMNVGDAFSVLFAHERRHLWQLRNVTREAAYPRL